MIFDGTYIDKQTERELEEQLGKPFGLIERFKLGGTGSHRMIIDKASNGFNKILERSTGTVYGSIERRPKGILVHFNVKNTRYSWSIPFYKMVFYRSDYFSVHADGEFLSFRKNSMLDRNKIFLSELMTERNERMKQFQGGPNDM